MSLKYSFILLYWGWYRLLSFQPFFFDVSAACCRLNEKLDECSWMFLLRGSWSIVILMDTTGTKNFFCDHQITITEFSHLRWTSRLADQAPDDWGPVDRTLIHSEQKAKLFFFAQVSITSSSSSNDINGCFKKDSLQILFPNLQINILKASWRILEWINSHC